MKRLYLFLLVCVFCLSTMQISLNASEETTATVIDMEELKQLVHRTMKKAGVPGLSIAVDSGDESVFLSYGTANRQGEAVTSHTYFEIGSMSKAFTAMGIYLLEEEGKLKLTDPVSNYLPFLFFRYKGYDDPVDITLEMLLHHKSGIPYKTITEIPEGDTEDKLYETVAMLQDTVLDFYPGTKYQYVTINYDILGLVIQEISGVSYETFIYDQILKPLGLNETYLFRDDARDNGVLADGYRRSFFTTHYYEAPAFRGNTPAGYIISNIVDMERWMKIQMSVISVPEPFSKIIEKSHMGDITVPSSNDYRYGGGWNVSFSEDSFFHGGNNPNYSSMISINKKNGIGVCVLSNINSNAAEYIVSSLMNQMQNKKALTFKHNIYYTMDQVFSSLYLFSLFSGAVLLFLLIKSVFEIIREKRAYIHMKGAKFTNILFLLLLMMILAYTVYLFPNIFLNLNWSTVDVWGSDIILQSCVLGYIALFLFMIYIVLIFHFPKPNRKNYVATAVLSILNGISSSLIIFTINKTFARNLEDTKELLICFICVLLFFVYTIQLLQGRLIILTNEMTFEKRKELIQRITASSYSKIEQIGIERIYSGLQTDCNAISKIPNLLVWFTSNTFTLLFCLGFLFISNIAAFGISLAVIVLNGIISVYISKKTVTYWEKNRTIQDVYFSQMQDMVYGIKELLLNITRRVYFWKSVKKQTRISTDLNVLSSLRSLNLHIISSVLQNVVFAVVVFIYPILYISVDSNAIREILYIVFFMLGPFRMLLEGIPKIMKVRINIERINSLINQLDQPVADEIDQTAYQDEPAIHIVLKDVVFTYQDPRKTGEQFILGPISADIHSGLLTYITGGNGSGKSTLAKVITGLYEPTSGYITVNGKEVCGKQLRTLFASVFSDYHLFQKLYGIPYLNKKKDMQEIMQTMKIDKKLSIDEQGYFSTIELSTGQKKRLALVVSCLEGKCMLLLDEWAAEQDPEFKRVFYDELLPDLKKKGVGVIVITHDDRYFNKADKIINMERGVVVQNSVPQTV